MSVGSLWELPGLIKKAESLMKSKFGNTSEEAQKSLFAEYDFNRDGRISVAELKKLITDLGYRDADLINEFVKDIMKLADSTRDLYISREKLKAKLGWHD